MQSPIHGPSERTRARPRAVRCPVRPGGPRWASPCGRIREPAGGSSGSGRAGPSLPGPRPRSPSLDQVWGRLVLEVLQEPAGQQLLAFVTAQVVADASLLSVQGQRERVRPRLDLPADVWEAPLLPDRGLPVHVVVDEDRHDPIVDEVTPVDT